MDGVADLDVLGQVGADDQGRVLPDLLPADGQGVRLDHARDPSHGRDVLADLAVERVVGGGALAGLPDAAAALIARG